MPQNLSPIQNRIISRLKNAKSLRYSELQQEGVPNDLFNYHLQFLAKKGLVDRKDDGYSLSESGIRLIADPIADPGGNAITSLFKVNVITIVSRIEDGKMEILNQRRRSNPSYGKVGVMGGVVWKGEPLAEAASRKLEAETGLFAHFRIVGMERRMLYHGEKLFSDVCFPIAYAAEYEGKLKPRTEFGENFWVPIDVAIANERHEYDSIESIPKVLQAAKGGKIAKLPFFFAETIRVKK